MNLPTCGAVLLGALLFAPAATAMSLSDARQLMRERNTELLGAAAEVRGAHADAALAGLRPQPELSIGSSKISPHHGIGSGRWQHKRIDSTLGLEWTWERGGKRRLRTAQANASLQASHLDLLDTQRLQELALHEHYFELKAAEELAQLAQDNLDASAEALRAARQEVATGAMAPLQLTRLAADDLAVADQARQAQHALRAARAELALLLGLEAGDALRADDPWPNVEQDVGSGTPAIALAERSDVSAAAQRLRSAEAGVALARSGRHRDVQVGVEMEREPEDISGVTWGLTLSVPLGGRARWQGEQARALADRDLAELELQQRQRQMRSEIDQLRLDAMAAVERRQAYEAMAAAGARSSLEGMELAYRRGAASLTDLLDARRSWRELETELIDARAGHALALARLRAATYVQQGETL